MQRPPGVVIGVGVISIVFGVSGLSQSIFTYPGHMTGLELWPSMFWVWVTRLSLWTMFVGSAVGFLGADFLFLIDWIVALISLIMGAVGVGLLLLTNWARRLTVFGAGITALLWLLFMVTPEGRTLLTGWVSLIPLTVLAWNGLVCWYFLRPSVKAQFQAR